MSFMQPQITHELFQIIENTAEGTIVCPVSACQYSNNEAASVYGVDPEDVTAVFRFGARISAPGYLDCADWAVFDTEKKAAEYLLEMYEDELDTDEIEALKEVN